ncbi:MAG: leucine-rich repeat domain-containing protein [Ruminococcaceae bacterium]|nr:leucine-rich repeat domain-containing protein [Oscillospiraceae bacterium]
MRNIKYVLSLILVMAILLSSLSVNMTVNADEASEVIEEDVVIADTAAQREDDELEDDIAEAPSTVTEKGMQFKIDNLQDVKSIRYAYGEYDTEKAIKYGADSVSHSAKNLRKRGDSCVLQFPKAGLVSIVITYNDGTRDFYKYDVIKSSPTVTRDGGNTITFGNLSDLKVLRYVKGEYDSSYDIKRAKGSVAISGKTLTSDTYTATLDRETYTFCVQYNDESYNYYVTGVCGDNLTWIYDMQSATLTISGEGEMYNYSNKMPAPWSLYSDVTEKLIVGEGTKTIGKCGFSDFEMLVDICLPTTLEIINKFGFSGCNSLINITLPNSIYTIESGAFAFCEILETVDLGNSVKTMGQYVFHNCKKLKELHFPDSIEYLDDAMAYGCDSLSVITLPDRPIYIGDSAIPLKAYISNPDNAKDIDEENGLYYVGNHLIRANKTETCIHEIREGTFSIAGYTFDHRCIGNTSYVKVPESVNSIGSSAFCYYPLILCYENSCAHKYAIEREHKYMLIN